MTLTKITHVAAAILCREDGTFLLAQRPVGKVYAGYWEFPGGKIEPNESAYQALCRELHEELGIRVLTAFPWLTQVFTYPHATVKLHFFRVMAWEGEPSGCENQQLSWQYPTAITVSPILPANTPVLRALTLPTCYGISNAAELGTEVFLLRLQLALQGGLRLIQVREKQLAQKALTIFARQVVDLAHRYDAKVLVNGSVQLAEEVGADGVHFTSMQLAQCHARPSLAYCAASCHTTAELQRAGELGFDFAVLSPVLPTLSHPNAVHLGWTEFASRCAEAILPVYALGGLSSSDLAVAQQHGAHGIALLRQAW
ncbi:MAG: Nudix family hydrolase [Gallionella sp.]|nr:Nudix family hydrolase [Gallionella sp.]MDD4959567.1 Nudix family hydrolase [Gallionella sp.]